MHTFNHNIRQHRCTVSEKCRNYCDDYIRPIGSFKYSDYESFADYHIIKDKDLKNNHHIVHKMYNSLDFRSRCGITPIVEKSYKIGGEDVW